MTKNNLVNAVAVPALIALFCACGSSAPEQLAQARVQVTSGAYADAVATAQAGLAASPDAVTQWGLELVILEAHARSGDGEATKAQLAKLVDAYPDRISATDYSGTAQLLQTADQKAAAVEIMDLGVKRFPEDAALQKMIKDSVAAGSDPEELQMLKSLGYID